MTRSVAGVSLMLLFLAATPGAVAAQQPAQPPGQFAVKAAPDPNEVICEKEQDSGSRISTKRVCMTRSQWAEQRRLNRQDIEKIQTQRPCNDRC